MKKKIKAYIKMEKKIIKFGDNKIEKQKLHQYQYLLYYR